MKKISSINQGISQTCNVSVILPKQCVLYEYGAYLLDLLDLPLRSAEYIHEIGTERFGTNFSIIFHK